MSEVYLVMIFADRNILPRRLGSIGVDRWGNRPAEPVATRCRCFNRPREFRFWPLTPGDRERMTGGMIDQSPPRPASNADGSVTVRPAVAGSLPALGLSALGVVFGDIGTSPLYTLKTVLGFTPGSPDE